MDLREKVVNIGTKTLALYVAYSNLNQNRAWNEEGEKLFVANRNSREYSSEEAWKLPRQWKESEIEQAIKEVAHYLVHTEGVIPIHAADVRDFVDDRYEKLSSDQKTRFWLYCRQEAGLPWTPFDESIERARQNL